MAVLRQPAVPATQRSRPVGAQRPDEVANEENRESREQEDFAEDVADSPRRALAVVGSGAVLRRGARAAPRKVSCWGREGRASSSARARGGQVRGVSVGDRSLSSEAEVEVALELLESFLPASARSGRRGPRHPLRHLREDRLHGRQQVASEYLHWADRSWSPNEIIC